MWISVIHLPCESWRSVLPKARLSTIDPGMTQRAGAVLDAELYNRLVDYASKMDVDMAWLIRHALRDFVQRHEAQLEKNPTQLALNLTL